MAIMPFRFAASLMFYAILALDVAVLPLSGAIALEWRTTRLGGVGQAGYVDLLLLSALMSAGFSIGIYQSWRGGAGRAMLGRVTLMWALTWGLLLVWLVFTKTSSEYSRIWLGAWLALSLAMLWMERLLAWGLLVAMRKRGAFSRDVVLVGNAKIVAEVRRRMRSSSWTGFKLVKVVAPEDVADLEEEAKALQPQEIWLSVDTGDHNALHKMLDALRHTTANIRLLPDLGNFRLINHGVSVQMGMPMLDLAHSPMGGINLVLKEVEDRLLAALILLLISPLMILIAIAVKLDSPGPVFFKQRRHGWHGKEIWIYKFRSMTVHEEHGNQVTQATKGDSRITRLGAFLRSSSLDELPQFINVLQGRMSVVGPRPHALAHNHHYKELIHRYMLRHKVKPGITGWAQVNGHRGETDTLDKMQARVEHDLFYIENWSVWLDLKIVFFTVFKGFRHQNAY